jgi:hypothetical protein
MSRDPRDKAMDDIFFGDRPRLTINGIKPFEDEYFETQKGKNMVKVKVCRVHRNGEDLHDVEVPVKWNGVESAKAVVTLHPSKKEAGKFYWKASLTIEGREKPIEKFGKLFEGDEAAMNDFSNEPDIILAQMLHKAYMNEEATR